VIPYVRWLKGLNAEVPQWFVRLYCKGMGYPLEKVVVAEGEVVTDGGRLWRFNGRGWDQVLLLGDGILRLNGIPVMESDAVPQVTGINLSNLQLLPPRYCDGKLIYEYTID
jgi:hypothetical protein